MITPEQLHKWYLDCIGHLRPDAYNPKAVRPYAELTEEQKEIDKYIASKVNAEIERLEADMGELSGKYLGLQAELASLKALHVTKRAVAMQAVCEAVRKYYALQIEYGRALRDRQDTRTLWADYMNASQELQQALAALDAVEKGEKDDSTYTT